MVWSRVNQVNNPSFDSASHSGSVTRVYLYHPIHFYFAQISVFLEHLSQYNHNCEALARKMQGLSTKVDKAGQFWGA